MKILKKILMWIWVIPASILLLVYSAIYKVVFGISPIHTTYGQNKEVIKLKVDFSLWKTLYKNEQQENKSEDKA
jgi:hypothetical protein